MEFFSLWIFFSKSKQEKKLPDVFYRYFLLGFYDTMYYNIKNWVWICWSGQDSNFRRDILHAVNHVNTFYVVSKFCYIIMLLLHPQLFVKIND